MVPVKEGGGVRLAARPLHGRPPPRAPPQAHVAARPLDVRSRPRSRCHAYVAGRSPTPATQGQLSSVAMVAAPAAEGKTKTKGEGRPLVGPMKEGGRKTGRKVRPLL